MQDQIKMVALGKFGRPKGLKGDLYFDSYNEDSEYLRPGVEVYLNGDQEKVAIESLSSQSKRIVLHLQEIDSRDAAEDLTGKEMLVPRSWLPELAEGQYYVVDLLGCEVFDLSGQSLGILKEVMSAPGNEIYVLNSSDGAERMVPILEGVLQNVDLEHGRITLNPLEEVDAF